MEAAFTAREAPSWRAVTWIALAAAMFFALMLATALALAGAYGVAAILLRLSGKRR